MLKRKDQRKMRITRLNLHVDLCLQRSICKLWVVCRYFCKFGWPCYPTSQSSSIVKYFLVVIHSSLMSIKIDTQSLIND